MNICDAMIALLNEAGYPSRKYSGRGMYGKECLAMTTTDNPVRVGCRLDSYMPHISIEARNCIEEECPLEDILSDSKLDNISNETVVYWPNIVWDPTANEDEDLIMGTNDEQTIMFDRDDIRAFVLNDTLNAEQMQDIANILAYNVDEPKENEYGYVEITRENFNDSFHDMEADLANTFKDPNNK